MDLSRAMQVYIAFGLIVVSAATKQCDKFEHNSVYDDQIDETNILKTTTAISVLHCSQSCSAETDCVAFYFTPTTRECQQHRAVSHSDYSVWSPKQGARYYQMYINVSGQFVCPLDNGEWVTNRLPDGTVGKYLLVFDGVALAHEEARSYCESQGAHLIKIVTAEKMDFYMNNFLSCPALNMGQFWIDGKNTPTNFDYITHDGDVVPRIPELWDPGKPASEDTKHCIQSTPQFNYMLDDILCTQARHQILCEKIQVKC